MRSVDGNGQTGSDVMEPLEFLLLDVVVADALSADDTLHERRFEQTLNNDKTFGSLTYVCRSVKNY